MSLAASIDFLPLGLFWGTSSLPLSDHVVRQGCPSPGLRKLVTCPGHAQWVSALRLLLEILGKIIFFSLGGKVGECEPGGCPAGSLWGVGGGRGGCGGAQREVGLGEGHGFAQLRTSCA